MTSLGGTTLVRVSTVRPTPTLKANPDGKEHDCNHRHRKPWRPRWQDEPNSAKKDVRCSACRPPRRDARHQLWSNPKRYRRIPRQKLSGDGVNFPSFGDSNLIGADEAGSRAYHPFCLVHIERSKMHKQVRHVLDVLVIPTSYNRLEPE